MAVPDGYRGKVLERGVWAGLVSLKRSGRSDDKRPVSAYAIVVASARTRFSFRQQAGSYAASRGWQVDGVLDAEPLEQWLAPMPEDEWDLDDPPDPVQDAKDDADVRALAALVATDGATRSLDWDEVPPHEEEPRSLNERLGEGAFRLLWWIGVPIFMAFTLPLLIHDAGPAYRAEFGHGTPGTFTAVSRDCDKSCVSTGDWRSLDGRQVRRHVTLASGAGAPHPGQTSAAVDTGDRVSVYPAGGNSDWLFITGFLTILTGVSVVWLYLVIGRLREWRVRRAR